MKNTIWKSLVSIFFLGMVSINALAVLLPINGQSTGAISDLYPNGFTPAGFTFGIWSVIYLWLLVFVVAQWFFAHKLFYKELSLNFVLSCMANLLWILAWHYLLPWLALVIMLVLLVILMRIFLLMEKHSLDATDKFLLQYPFHVYLGWISVATIANTAAALVSIPWLGAPFTQSSWTISMLIIATGLSMFMVIRFKSVFYSMVTVWALYGIFSRWRASTENLIGEVSLALIVFLTITIVARLILSMRKNVA